MPGRDGPPVPGRRVPGTARPHPPRPAPPPGRGGRPRDLRHHQRPDFRVGPGGDAPQGGDKEPGDSAAQQVDR